MLTSFTFSRPYPKIKPGRVLGGQVTGAQSLDHPQEPLGPSSGLYYAKVLWALCLVIGLILIVYYFAKKFGRHTPLLAGANLGTVLGRIHLTRGATLYYVETGGKILIVGVTGNSISSVGEFDAADLDPEEETEGGGDLSPEDFLSQLQSTTKSMSQSIQATDDDDDIATLRGDIERLQQYLQEESRGVPD
jgi:flagellar biogenesis protein FliO